MSDRYQKFTVPQESIAGLPTIEFRFDGAFCQAELAGAGLVADACADDRANLQITDADGEILVDVMVRKTPSDKDITEAMLRVGSALLWSHARYVEAKAAPPIPPPPGWTPREFDPAKDHVVTPADITP